MRMLDILLLVASSGLIAALVLAQSPPQAPGQGPAPLSCEQHLEAQYRGLVGDKLLTDQPGLPWAQQLLTLVTQIRTGQTQYDIKKNQAELAERNVAQLLEQLRQAQQQAQTLSSQNAELRSELEKLRNGATPQAN
jgi:uncharacterized protein YlxW (UPF0749 family)